MRALLVTGENQYGVLNYFAEGMRQDLIQLGVSIDHLDLANENTIAQSVVSVRRFDEYDFIVNINAVGLNLNFSQGSLPEYANKKTLFIYLVDHPIHLLHRFIHLPVTMLCVDQEHVGFCQLCGLNAQFFPHAIGASQAEGFEPLNFSHKKQQTLFPISYSASQTWKSKLEPFWSQLGLALERADNVTRFMQMIGLVPIPGKPANTQLTNDIRVICIYADMYIRARRREAFLMDCQQRGLQLTVVGLDTHKYDALAPAHTYIPQMPFPQLLAEIRVSQWVAHLSPGFELGGHERLMHALALGTPVISESTAYTQKHFSGCLLSPKDFESNKMSLQEYQQLQLLGQNTALSEHTWLERWRVVLSGATGQQEE